MNTGFIEITWVQLALSALFLLFAGLFSWKYRLGVEKDLFIGGVRCVVQLLAMGYLLNVLFGMQSAVLVVLFMLFVGTFASRVVSKTVKEQVIPFFWPTFWAMQGSYFLMTLLVTFCIIGADPWWSPHIVIPIGGMVAGKTMNSLAIVLERFFMDLRKQRAEIELFLLLGATPKEASKPLFKEALRASMIPTINTLMGVGIVFLPGMMTGQVLAGIVPEQAVRYQIVVMFMLVAVTGLASFVALTLIRRRCFTSSMSLLVR